MDRSDIISMLMDTKKGNPLCMVIFDISWQKPLVVLYLLPVGQINYDFLPIVWAIRSNPLEAYHV